MDDKLRILAAMKAVLGNRLTTIFPRQGHYAFDPRPQFANALGIGNHRPDLVVRFGRGPEMPRSRRRPVQAVIV